MLAPIMLAPIMLAPIMLAPIMLTPRLPPQADSASTPTYAFLSGSAQLRQQDAQLLYPPNCLQGQPRVAAKAENRCNFHELRPCALELASYSG
jgi:hypothetical protein